MLRKARRHNNTTRQHNSLAFIYIFIPSALHSLDMLVPTKLLRQLSWLGRITQKSQPGGVWHATIYPTSHRGRSLVSSGSFDEGYLNIKCRFDNIGLERNRDSHVVMVTVDIEQHTCVATSPPIFVDNSKYFDNFPWMTWTDIGHNTEWPYLRGPWIEGSLNWGGHKKTYVLCTLTVDVTGTAK